MVGFRTRSTACIIVIALSLPVPAYTLNIIANHRSEAMLMFMFSVPQYTQCADGAEKSLEEFNTYSELLGPITSLCFVRTNPCAEHVSLFAELTLREVVEHPIPVLNKRLSPRSSNSKTRARLPRTFQQHRALAGTPSRSAPGL